MGATQLVLQFMHVFQRGFSDLQAQARELNLCLDKKFGGAPHVAHCSTDEVAGHI